MSETAKLGLESSPTYRDALDKNSHLREYVNNVTRELGSEPIYLEQLSRDLRYLKRINIIYPVGDPIFIHIYTKTIGDRAIYHPIEPSIPKSLKRLRETVEDAIALVIDESYDFRTSDEQRELLFKAIDKVIKIDGKLKKMEDYRVEDKGDHIIIHVNEDGYNAIKYTLEKEKIGIGIIEPLIRDPYIEDISCSGVGPIFVEHKIFSSCRTTIEVDTEEELNDFIIRLSERIGKPASYRRPIIDATLPDGSRINIVFGRDVSIKGSNFTIRKFTGKPLSIIQLCMWNTMDFLEAAYIWMLLENGLSLWVCGETASGKTTTLKAIIPFIRPNAKIVSIEDTPEILCPHENWTREVTREGEDKSASVQMYDLLRAALRQRPNYIIVGEIRGVEGAVAFQAMQTGHPVLSTFHAASVEKLIQRLTGSPIDIPKTYIDNLNAVIIQSAVRLPKTGMVERRVLSINEIIGFDPIEETFNFIELFSWEAANDTHIFRGEGMSYILEEKIATMKGLSVREKRKIYEELFLRREILRLMADNGIIDYYDTWSAFRKIHEIGVGEAYRRLRREGSL